MADIDFYNYQKNIVLESKLTIDISNLDVKPDASLVNINEDGGVEDLNANEIIDEKINFIYNQEVYNNQLRLDSDPEPPEPKLYDEGIAYRRGEPVIAESDLIDYDRTLEEGVLLRTTGVNSSAEETNYKLEIVPQHEKLLTSNSTRDPLIDREMYAVMGMWPTNGYRITTNVNAQDKRQMGIWDSEASGYLSKKNYDAFFNALQTKFNELNIGIIRQTFSKSVSEEGELDVNDSGITRGKKFNETINNGVAFINRHDSLDEIPEDEISPFSMSVKEVFKAHFSTPEEMMNELIDLIDGIIESLSIPGISIIVGNTPPPSLTFTPNGKKIKNPAWDGVDNDTKYLKDGTAFIMDVDVGKNAGTDIRKLVSDIIEFTDVMTSYTGKYSNVSINIALSGIRDTADRLKLLRKKIKWYERYTNESILDDNKLFLGENKILTGRYNTNKKLARILIPVDFGIQHTKEKRSGWLRRYRVKKTDLKIRWIEIRFIDTRVLSKYRQNERESGTINNFDGTPISATLTTSNNIDDKSGKLLSVDVTVVTDDPHQITENSLQVTMRDSTVMAYNGYFTPILDDDSDDNTFKYKIPTPDGKPLDEPAGDIVLNSVIDPFQSTKPDEERVDVNIDFDIPHLPFDDDLRDEAYINYGPFDQSEFSNRETEVPHEVTNQLGNTFDITDPEAAFPPGFEIFRDSSKEISDMRKGLDIYNKVQFLIQILKSEFNKGRIKLIDTSRSWEDQHDLQSGGSVSEFLSWYNYGLAVKILITKEDGTTMLEENSEEFNKLCDIALAYTDAVKTGKLGTPMNVIWGAQLVTGPDMFNWEFLPIGVNHRDAWKFRQDIYNQLDPVISRGYVNVDDRNYVLSKNAPVIDNEPYIRKDSTAYKEAIIIDGKRYVSPENINNFFIPNNLVLKDIQEFLFMVKQKMASHGTELETTAEQWKAKNPISYSQLMTYYSLIGNYSAVRAILSMDYVEKFDYIIATADDDPITFVKNFMGDSYDEIKIFIDNLGDNSYISLSTGKLTTPVLDVRSTHPDGSGNTFGQKLFTTDSAEFGQYTDDGIFKSEDGQDIEYVVSDNPVIDGYDSDGNPMSDEALLIHLMIKNTILEEFKTVKELTNNTNINFMYDELLESPNKGQLDLLENEFGIIKTQTLFENEDEVIPIPDLKDILTKGKINDKKKSPIDAGVRGAGANIEESNEDIDFDKNPSTNINADRNERQSVFEKLISNAQMQGVQKARLTKEKPIIEPLQGNVTVEKVIKDIEKKNIPDVRDIL